MEKYLIGVALAVVLVAIWFALFVWFFGEPVQSNPSESENLWGDEK